MKNSMYKIIKGIEVHSREQLVEVLENSIYQGLVIPTAPFSEWCDGHTRQCNIIESDKVITFSGIPGLVITLKKHEPIKKSVIGSIKRGPKYLWGK